MSRNVSTAGAPDWTMATSSALSGTVIKLAGQISPDPETGRLAATFDDNPQLPFALLRMELKSGDLLTGFLVKEDANAVTVRPIGADDRAIPRSEIKSTRVTRKSLMPEGLLDGMQPGDVRDLFAYLNTLK